MRCSCPFEGIPPWVTQCGACVTTLQGLSCVGRSVGYHCSSGVQSCVAVTRPRCNLWPTRGCGTGCCTPERVRTAACPVSQEAPVTPPLEARMCRSCETGVQRARIASLLAPHLTSGQREPVGAALMGVEPPVLLLDSHPPLVRSQPVMARRHGARATRSRKYNRTGGSPNQLCLGQCLMDLAHAGSHV